MRPADPIQIPGLTPAPPAPPWQRCTLPHGELRLPDGKRLTPMPPLFAAGVLSAAWGSKHGMRVLATLDRLTDEGWGHLLHVSISFRHRDPSWAEIKAVKAVFFGDQDAMLILPSAAHYINIMGHCFQLYQCPEPWKR